MKRGFSLIELLTVIAIIGILAGVVTVNVSSARSKARDSRRKADVGAVSSALEMYYAQNKKYPACTNAWIWQSSAFSSAIDVFITLPKDPQKQTGFGQGYIYYCDLTTEGKYVVDATLEGNYESTVDLTFTNPQSPSEADFWKTGIYCTAGKCHYRIANK